MQIESVEENRWMETFITKKPLNPFLCLPNSEAHAVFSITSSPYLVEKSKAPHSFQKSIKTACRDILLHWWTRSITVNETTQFVPHIFPTNMTLLDNIDCSSNPVNCTFILPEINLICLLSCCLFTATKSIQYVPVGFNWKWKSSSIKCDN